MTNTLLEGRLEHAVAAATIAHMGQKDKAGLPYILHPMAVCVAMDDEDSRIVAILHDCIEDTKITLDDIREDLGNTITDALDAISKRDGEKLEDYWERVKNNPLALKVKLKDIAHNLSPNRQEVLPQEDQVYLQAKYKRAIDYLAK